MQFGLDVKNRQVSGTEQEEQIKTHPQRAKMVTTGLLLKKCGVLAVLLTLYHVGVLLYLF